MKNIEKGSIKHLVYLILFTALFGMILYPLFGLFYCKVITSTEFVYSFYEYIVQPTLFAIIFSVTYWVVIKK